MALTHQQILAIHQKATINLAMKLACIPKRVLPTGSYPTMHKYYTLASTTHIPGIPARYQLDFLLGNYNKLLVVDFKAIKLPNADIDVVKAIWYYQIDQSHSFSRFHRIIRLNILVAVIVGASSNPSAYCTGSSQQFLLAFMRAWKEAVSQSADCTARDAFVRLWAEGPHDLMYWSSPRAEKMAGFITHLTDKVPVLPFLVEWFWERVRQQPQSEWEAHGHSWATQWIVAIEKEGAKKAKQGVKGSEMDGVEAAMGGFGLEDVPSYLCEELFQQPHVQALLQDIDEDVERIYGAMPTTPAPANPNMKKKAKTHGLHLPPRFKTRGEVYVDGSFRSD